MHRPALATAALLAAAGALLALAACNGDGCDAGEAGAGDWVTVRGEAMSTSLAVTLPDRPGAEAAGGRVVERFHQLEDELSEWREGSPLAVVNQAAGGEPVAVPADLLAVVGRGLAIARRTGGAFDPTWASLWGLWDFRAAAPRVPPADEIARRAALVDYRAVELDAGAGTLRLPRPGMQIGLGGIAKGWALDRAAAELRAAGWSDFLIVAGGQVYAAGERGGRPWRVGVRDPRGGPEDFFATLSLRDRSTSTSGDYESFFVVDGVRYHHILDPRTGYPARGLRSATAVTANATLADALSTALMVLGPEDGLALATELPRVEALLVDAEGTVLTTPGFDAVLELHRSPRR